MFYADLKTKPDRVFKRLTGVRPATFIEMCAALEKQLPVRGRKPKRCRQDQLLLTLMYWREYRTFVHIGQTYGLSESAVCRTVHAVEAALLCCGQFTLPGKKALTKSDLSFEVIVVDATECPVERPKKNNGTDIAVKRSATPKKRRLSPTQRPSAS